MGLKRVVAGALGLGALIVGGVAVPASAAPSSTARVYTINSRSPQVIDAGVVHANTMITLARGHGTTTWDPRCGATCSTTYTDGRLSGTLVPCGPHCLAPGLPTGAIVYKIGRWGQWNPYNGSPNHMQPPAGQHLYIGYNDDRYVDNRGSYVDLLVAQESTLPSQ